MKQALVLSRVLVALAILTAAPAFGGQDVLLSKKSKGFNDQVAFAVNPHNGDLLAVWHRHAPRGFERSRRETIFADCFMDNPFARRLLEERKFQSARPLTRMVRGTNQDPGRPELICAALGPEFG